MIAAGPRISRLRPAIELAAVVGLVAIDLWLAADRVWLQALLRTLAAAIVLASLWRRRGALAESTQPASHAWLEAAVGTAVLGLAVVIWAATVLKPFDEIQLPPLGAAALGLWLVHRLSLALVQQLVLQVFLGPVAREALGRGFLALLVVAGLFGLGHLPSVPFAIFTTLAAVFWLLLYRRSRRLTPLVVSHVLLACLASTLPERLFLGLKVGAPALEIAAEQQYLASEAPQALLGAVTSAQYANFRLDDPGYVEGLYRDLLGRVATDDEVRAGVDLLLQISRLALAKRMLLSPEIDRAALWRRFIDDEPLPADLEITSATDSDSFTGWWETEDGWRWARDETPRVAFRIDPELDRDYVLALSGGAAAPVTVELELNGQNLGSGRFSSFAPHDHRFLLDATHLVADRDKVLRFLISGTPAALPGESRALGFGLRRLRIAPLRFPAAAILFDQDDYFLTGFSVAEERLRWTREPQAQLVYPIREILPDACYVLRLRAGAFKTQSLQLAVNERPIADWIFEGLEPQIRVAHLDTELLTAGTNRVDFHLPEAQRPAGDPRQLGLALMSLAIYPSQDCA